MKIKRNPLKPLWAFMICFFMLSEYCPGFELLERLHVKHYILMVSVFLLGVAQCNALKRTEELKRWGMIVGGLFGISLLLQIFHEKFQWFTIEQLYYMVIPFLFIYLVFNFGEVDEIDGIVTETMLCGMLSVLLRWVIQRTFTIQNILHMLDLRNLFIDSTSPMGESGLSAYFVIMLIFFIYRRKTIRAILCAVFCFMCYKRFAVFFMLVTVIFWWLLKMKRVHKVWLWSAIAVLLFLPFAAKMMCTDSFSAWFYTQYGIDFNKFTMTRFYIINTVIDANLTSYGLGTVTNFLEQRGASGQLNMHNDILMIYMDCSIVGSYVFTKNFFYMCRSNYCSFWLMLFVFGQMFVTHCLGAGTVTVWLLIYTLVFYFNREARRSENVVASEDKCSSCTEG